MTDNLEKIHLFLLQLLLVEHFKEAVMLCVSHSQKITGAKYASFGLIEDGAVKKLYDSDPLLHDTKIPVGEAHTSLHMQSHLAFPLLVKKKKFGVIALYSQAPKFFTSEKKTLLTKYLEAASLILQKIKQYEETQQTLRKREEYIAFASHELRNPLTSINGYIQMLYSKRQKDESSEYRWIKQLYVDSQRFTELLKDLLNIEKIRKQE